jgi:hypothetical protein
MTVLIGGATIVRLLPMLMNGEKDQSSLSVQMDYFNNQVGEISEHEFNFV